MQLTHARQGLERNSYALSAATGFARLALDLHAAPDLNTTITHVLGFARQVVPCEVANIMLRDRRRQRPTAEVSDPRITGPAALQIDHGDGPWLALGPAQHSVLVLDTTRDTRWPHWRRRVTGLGLRSVLSIRLATRRAELGSLNIYSTSPGRLTAADSEMAFVLAGHAAVAIESAQVATDLARAVEARTVVGQAQGILMAQFGMNPSQAFAVLRRYSQDANVKLLDIAREFVETRQLPEVRCAPPRTDQHHWRSSRQQYYDPESIPER